MWIFNDKVHNTATQTTFLTKPTTTNNFRKLKKSFDKSKINISVTTDIISVATDVIYQFRDIPGKPNPRPIRKMIVRAVII